MLLGSLWLVSCEDERAAEGPEDVVARFLREMSSVHGDPSAGDRVAELLWQPARQNLEERARRATALSGRELSAGEMMVPSWFSPRGVATAFESRIEGGWAEVHVTSSQGEVVTRCVQEDGAWKVVLELPPLSPIRQRESLAEQPDGTR